MSSIVLPGDFKKLRSLLRKRGIQTDAPGFYNQAAFMQEEGKDPAFLELYGAFVRLRPRSETYETHVRSIVPRMVAVVADEIRRDGQKGVCIDASMMLIKMLELQEIWCYGVNGALTIESPELASPTHFWPLDVIPVAGHVWIVAPPFEVVDVSLGCQAYSRGEDRFLPPYILAETGKRVVCSAEDYCSSDVLRRAREQYGPLPKDIHLRLDPHLKRRGDYFPSYEIESGAATLRYCAGGVSVSDAPDLHAITNRRWNGMLAGELYDRVISPSLSVPD